MCSSLHGLAGALRGSEEQDIHFSGSPLPKMNRLKKEGSSSCSCMGKCGYQQLERYLLTVSSPHKNA